MRKKRNRKKRNLRPQCAAWTLAFFLFFGLIYAAAAEELTLERALNIAIQKSPAMRQASLQLEISERNLMAQQAGLKSQFSLSLTPYRTSSSRVFNELTSTYNTQTQTRTGGRFSILQPIKWTDATLSVSNSFNWQEATSSFAGGEKQSAFSNSLTVSLNQPLFKKQA